MQNLARIILESFLFEKKTISVNDLQKIQPISKEKSPVFITVKDGENIVGSTGRIYPAHDTIGEELINNVILLASDPRFQPYIDNPEKTRKSRNYTTSHVQIPSLWRRSLSSSDQKNKSRYDTPREMRCHSLRGKNTNIWR